MSVLGNYEPKNVLGFFEEICGIPHGSHDTKKISDFLKKFAEDRNLECYQDELNNIIIIKEATTGYENSDPIILQGHMDMVCEKTPESTIDFKTDGLKLLIDGDWLTADGTTLGGDDGVAVAMCLAVLDSEELSHPRVEVILTVDEEVGLLGAEGIDVSMLKGKKFINIDSEEEGIFTTSCAGGVTTINTIPVTLEKAQGVVVSIKVDGLQGGHSGIEIDKERGNGNILMGRVLRELKKNAPFRIAELSGGTKDNAICKLTEAKIVIDKENVVKAAEVAAEMTEIYANEYRVTDPDVKVTCSVETEAGELEAADAVGTGKMITYLINTPNGIYHMSKDIDGLVETSLNLGALSFTDGVMKAMYAVRSSVGSRRDMLCGKLESLAEVLGGTTEYAGAYPGWEYKADSPLRDTCIAVFERMYGKAPRVEAIHAGLECGLFAGKIGKELDCVSIGPDMEWVHTPDERLSLSSTKRVWEFLVEVLKESK
ncbi:dipeptidase D [Peptostreptococcaceae bacterium pGA-8]|nr:dipeptidase D [Peptostreptococcaceae bacterium pGA-8]